MGVRAAAVVLGAGSGTRMGAGQNKVLLELRDVPVLAHSVRTALAVPEVTRVVLVVRPGEEEAVARAVAPHLAGADEVLLVRGGTERHDSEQAALTALLPDVKAGKVDVIAVHDGARPLAEVELWSAVIRAADATGGALPVRDVPGLVHRATGQRARDLAGVQTPQAFRAQDLVAAYAAAEAEGTRGTDTAATVERHRPHVRITPVPGPASNIKVTFPADLPLAEAVLAHR